MPYLTNRPLRYSPPTAASLRKASANHKIAKTQSDRHPHTAALRSQAAQQLSRLAGMYRQPYDSYRPNHGDNYRPEYDSYRPGHNTAAYGHHGERAQAQYGQGGFYGQYPGGGAQEARSGRGRRRGYGYEAGREESTGGTFSVQSQVPQQDPRQWQQQAQSYYPSGQQYWNQAGYSQDLYPASSANQGYSQQDNYSGVPYGQQRTSYTPAYPPSTWYPQQQEAYVSHAAYTQPQYMQYDYGYGFQQNQYLTQDRYAAGNLNANASTFQPQTANRVAPSPINYVPGTALPPPDRLPSKSPANKGNLPHLNVLKRPEPSLTYLKAAYDKEPLQTLLSPRQLLIVLDLNGTLLYRKPRGGSSFVARPKVDKFIKYLLSHHRVMVWSSAKPENVNPMCEKLFSKTQHEQLVAVWARDTLRIPPQAYSSKVQVYKQLSWIWKDKALQAKNADPTGVWDQTNTVLIDDSVEKAASEPHNLVCLEEFEDRPDQKESDVLGQVVKYLETLKWQKDVSAYMKRKPFEYDAGEVFDWKV